MNVISENSRGLFVVDLAELDRSTHPWWSPRRWFGSPRAVRMDLRLLGLALVDVARRSSVIAPDGRALACGAFVVRAPREDAIAYRQLVAAHGDLVRNQLLVEAKRLGVVFSDDTEVRVEPDHPVLLPSGSIAVRALNLRPAPAAHDPEVTLRGRQAPRAAPTYDDGHRDEPTDRVAEPLPYEDTPTDRVLPRPLVVSVVGDVLTHLTPGQRRIIGRVCTGIGTDVIALPDRDRRISRRHVSLLALGDSVLVQRCAGANPVLVDGEYLAEGASVRRFTFPVRVDLSGGARVLTVARA